MTTEPVKSRRGVYYDLSLSPYSYTSEYGDIFKFSSQKKLEIYTRDIVIELKRIDKMIERTNLNKYVPREIIKLIRRSVYKSFYHRVEV